MSVEGILQIMKNCRHPKSKPYGTTGTSPYCIPHDSCRTYAVIKKSARQKSKREIEETVARDQLERDHQMDVLKEMYDDDL